jgi:hypothetical protein
MKKKSGEFALKQAHPKRHYNHALKNIIIINKPQKKVQGFTK